MEEGMRKEESEEGREGWGKERKKNGLKANVYEHAYNTKEQGRLKVFSK